MAKKKKVTKAEAAREEEIRSWISIVLIAALVIITYMEMGAVGLFLNRLTHFLFGKWFYLLLIVVVVQIVITMINRRNGNTKSQNVTAVLAILAALLLICAYTDTSRDLKGFEILNTYFRATKSFFTDTPELPVAGGLLGALLVSVTTMLVDWPGTVLVIVVLIVVAALLLVNLEVYKQAFDTIVNYFSTEYEEDEEEDEEDDEPATPARIPHRQPRVIDSTPRRVQMITMNEAETEALPVSSCEEDQVRAAMDIRADEESIPEEEDPQLDSEPVKEEEEQESRSIFMDVDELFDHVVAEEPEPEPVLQQPTLPEIPVTVSQSGPVEEEQEESAGMAVASGDDPAGAGNASVEFKDEQEAPRKDRPYVLPPVTLLDPIPKKDKDDVNVKAAEEKGELLVQVLKNFDIDSQLVDTHVGPSVTEFEVRPDSNIKVSRILGLTDDIKMQLAVRNIRIEAPIPGHNAVGVEIPNQKATLVKMKELINRIPEKDAVSPLTIVLGKDLLGNCVTCRLDKMPHLLIAGATGSGKSVCMNSIITSILLRTKPEDVKLLLVDPKKVEFTPYQKIPHLIGPVINDPQQANNALKVIVKVMDDRYNAFAALGVRNIQGYNTKVETMEDPADGSPRPKKMPYIVVIIDEMADLMVVAGKEVEQSIQRITQLARAAGIHLIIATQRPSTDVITGVIKANIPSRIAFAVSSGIDSRTILDHVGAERLLGNGDMLYMPIGAPNAQRVQGVFITDEEVQRITDFVSSEAVPMYDDAFVLLEGVNDLDGTGGIGCDEDPLLDEIKDYVVSVQKASTSLLQRRFGIGYNRAARMIDLLEEKGIIGPAQGSKPRDVYLKQTDKNED